MARDICLATATTLAIDLFMAKNFAVERNENSVSTSS